MVYIVQRLSCPIDIEIGRDIDLWRTLVPEAEILDAEAIIWKVWTTSEVLCSDNIRLHAYSQDKGWHSVELITQTAPNYLCITHSEQHTIFTTISNSPDALEALVSLILNLYEEATIMDLLDFSKNNEELPVQSINLFDKVAGNSLYIAFDTPIRLEEMHRTYPKDLWNYLAFSIHSNLHGPIEVSRLYICPQSGQARFVFSDEESFAAMTELEKVKKLHEMTDTIFGKFVGALVVA